MSITGSVDTDVPKTYLLTYSATDSDNKTSSIKRTVIVTPPAGSLQILDVSIVNGNDDAEERNDGSMYLNSSDLELITDGSKQTVGLRFTGVNIPTGSTISRAYLQFETDETTSLATTLSISAQNEGSSATFDNSSNNVSNRPRTNSLVSWTPSAWTTVNERGIEQQSPELSAVVQEVINRADWGRESLAFIITGTGSRIAKSFENNGAVSLHIEYSNIPVSSDADIVINEFMASNKKILATKAGKFEDWIELYNQGSDAANLQGWCLSNDAVNQTQWCFPSVTLEAGEYRVIFASGDNIFEGDELHTNFKLGKKGEYLGLVKPDGTVADEYSQSYPVQENDVSYGRNSSGENRYFLTATPNAANNSGFIDLLQFSKNSLNMNENQSTTTVSLSALGDSATNYTLTVDDNTIGLTALGNKHVTEDQISIGVDLNGLEAGTYQGTVTASAEGYASTTLTVNLTVGETGTGGDVVINEFMASNKSKLPTAGGKFEDWIELYNRGSNTVDLQGWCLSDDATNKTQWCFPSVSLGAGNFLVLFASSDNVTEGAELHTNFKLGKKGEYLGLTRSDGTVADEYSENYPAQEDDVSYGIDKTGARNYLLEATPNAANSAAASGGGEGGSLQFDLSAIHFVGSNNTFSKTLGIDASTGQTVLYQISTEGTNIGWLDVKTAAGSDGTTTDQLTVQVDMSNLPKGTYTAKIIASATDYTNAEIKVTVTVLASDLLGAWDEAGMTLNDLPVVDDEANERLFYSLGKGYKEPKNVTLKVGFLNNSSYAVSFNGGTLLNSGDEIDLGEVTYESNITVQLYKNGSKIEDYAFILTILPLIEIKAESIQDEPKSPGIIRITSLEHDEQTGLKNMGIEFRGGTSQNFEKKSYGVEFTEQPNLQDSKSVKLFDLRKDDDWIMDAAYRDQIFVRNLVCHDLWRAVDEFAFTDTEGNTRGQSSIRGLLAEVVQNKRYQGIYVLEERVDRKLLDLDKIDVPVDSSGNELWDEVNVDEIQNSSVLYYAKTNEAGLFRTSLNDIRRDFEQKYPKESDLEHFKPLKDLIEFVVETNDTEFANGINNLIQMDKFVDYWLLYAVSQSTDTLHKNFYLAKNKDQKFFIVPWDLDATFDMKWEGSRDNMVNAWQEKNNNLFKRLLRIPNSGFNAKLKARWAELKSTVYSVDAIMDKFEGYYALLHSTDGNQTAFQRNEERWPDSGNNGKNNPELGEVSYIRDWIERRRVFLDQKINSLP